MISLTKIKLVRPNSLFKIVQQKYYSEMFRPETQPEFTDKKVRLFECSPKSKGFGTSNKFFAPVSLFFSIMTVKSMYFFRPIRTILWGFPTMVLLRMTTSTMLHAKAIIRHVELLDNGEEILIHTLNGKNFRTRIEDISKPNKEVAGPMLVLYKRMGLNYIPIQVGTGKQLMIIDQDGRFFQEEIMKAVINGITIDLSEQKTESKKGDEDIIDI